MASTASAVVRDAAVLADDLYAAHSASLLRYCRRKLDAADAEDAVQTTFLYATRALQRGVVPESESAWLHTIARNVCRWQRRTAARRHCVVSDPLAGPLADEPAPVRDGDLASEVREALALVPERQRQALVLREVQGLPAREVAATLGIAPGETYALLSRARRSFTRAYEAVTGRSSLGVQIAPLLLKLKSLLSGGAATVVAATSIAGGVAVGVGGAGESGSVPQRTPPAVVAPGTTSPGAPLPAAAARSASAPGSLRAGARQRRGTTSGVVLPAEVGGAIPHTAGPSETRDETLPSGSEPSGDAPGSPSERPRPAEPAPSKEPDLGLDLPLEVPSLPEVGEVVDPLTSDPLPDVGEVVDPLTDPLPDEPLPGLPALSGLTAPLLP